MARFPPSAKKASAAVRLFAVCQFRCCLLTQDGRDPSGTESQYLAPLESSSECCTNFSQQVPGRLRESWTRCWMSGRSPAAGALYLSAPSPSSTIIIQNSISRTVSCSLVIVNVVSGPVNDIRGWRIRHLDADKPLLRRTFGFWVPGSVWNSQT
jgi:hypothetical protein